MKRKFASLTAYSLALAVSCAGVADAFALQAKAVIKTSAKGKAKAGAKPEIAVPADEAGQPDPKAKGGKSKADVKAASSKTASGKPLQVGTYGEWGAYVTQGAKEKTCYALAKPGQRLPAGLKRDPAYVFISTRPGENVRNEVSIIMGFGMKDGGEASADIGGEAFELLGKGPNAWVKNAAKEQQFVDALRKGSKLTVKAPSVKGNVTTDQYSLNGLGQALERVAKECQ